MAWRSDERDSQEAVTQRRSTASRGHPVDPEQYLAKPVTVKLKEGKFKAAVRLVCSDDRPAPCLADTLAALKQKHLPAAADRRPACSPTSLPQLDPLQITELDVKRVIRSLPAGSAVALIVSHHSTSMT